LKWIVEKLIICYANSINYHLYYYFDVCKLNGVTVIVI